jgi:hypothetical protein
MQENFLIDTLFPAAFIIMLTCIALVGVIFAITTARIYFLKKRIFDEHSRVLKNVESMINELKDENIRHKQDIAKIIAKLDKR